MAKRRSTKKHLGKTVRELMDEPPVNRHYTTTVMDDMVQRSDPLLRGVDVNALGGRQSKINGRYDLLDFEAIKRLAQVLELGAKKRGEQNWRLIPRRDHLNHLLFHVSNVIELMDAGHSRGYEEIEENLDRALCRAMMALASRH